MKGKRNIYILLIWDSLNYFVNFVSKMEILSFSFFFHKKLILRIFFFTLFWKFYIFLPILIFKSITLNLFGHLKLTFLLSSSPSSNFCLILLKTIKWSILLHQLSLHLCHMTSPTDKLLADSFFSFIIRFDFSSYLQNFWR